MMKNKIKKIIIIFIIILISMCKIPTVNAGGGGTPGNPGGPGGGGGGNGSGTLGANKPSPCQANCDCSCSFAGCSTQSGIPEDGVGSWIWWEQYDILNNPISGQKILAGMAFGNRLYEEYEVYWYGVGSAIYSCVARCKKAVTSQEAYIKPDGTSAWREVTVMVDEPPKYYSSSGPSAECQRQAEVEGYLKAKKYLMEEQTNAYIVRLDDPNDADCVQKPNKEECKTYDVPFVAGAITPNCDINNSNVDLYRDCNPVRRNFYYEMYGSCIDVKTGKVRYLTNSSESCNDVEYYIKNDDINNELTRHWHIFVPLNTKEIDEYKIEFSSKKIQTNGSLCMRMIRDNEDNYKDLIKPIGREFEGNSIESHKRQVANGCEYRTIITVPISQKFYNQINEGKNFEGFNFYYKPIDINNPFPNGLSNTSLWHDWNRDPNQKPDLTDSYKEVTYIADVAENTTDIRKYKDNCGEKSCMYTSWYNMNVNGTSNFIQDKDYIIRKVQRSSYYPLGCGPLNSKNTGNNLLYQPECDKS